MELSKKNNFEDVFVIGLGYVGLTLAVTLARSGLKVTGVDKSETVLNSLKNGVSHFYEKELDKALGEVLGRSLQITSELKRSASPSAFIISVGTPVDQATKQPLLTQVTSITSSIASILQKGDLIVLRSTVPVGTSNGYVLKVLAEKSGLVPGEDFYFAFAPERTVEGKAMMELVELPQIVGGYNQKSAELAASIFYTYNKDVVLVPDVEHAEMLKVIDNSYRDVVFSYANQIALICENIGLNFPLIREVANYHYPRNNVPMSSPGVGGACLTKDPYLLIDICKKRGINHQLISAGREINEYVSVYLGNQLLSDLALHNVNPKDAKVFILGMAFKGYPPTSDIRFSPTLDFFNAIREKIPNIVGYDPFVKETDFPATGIQFSTLEEGFKGAHAVVLMTNHSVWKEINIFKHEGQVHSPCLVYDHWDILPEKTGRQSKNLLFKGFGAPSLFPGYPIFKKSG